MVAAEVMSEIVERQHNASETLCWFV